MKSIKNIRLISSEDQKYRLYNSSFKSKNKSPENKRSKSEMISYVLELTTREWIKNSKLLLNDRIIAYEVYNYRTKEFETRFDEIDYVIKKGNILTIGEVKTSYDDSKVISIASKQLIRKSTLLKQIGFQVKMQIIHFDLCYNQSKKTLNTFYKLFSENEFSKVKRCENEFEYLHLSPTEIFDWGLSKSIIKTPELLNVALSEANQNFERKRSKLNAKIKCNENNEINRILKNLPSKVSNSTQGLCVKSETAPTELEIKKVLKNFNDESLKEDTIVIARYNWLLKNNFIIPNSKKLMNLFIQIKSNAVRRAFYSETPRELFKKLNYSIIVMN